jgi:hypothetical protein
MIHLLKSVTASLRSAHKIYFVVISSCRSCFVAKVRRRPGGRFRWQVRARRHAAAPHIGRDSPSTAGRQPPNHRSPLLYYICDLFDPNTSTRLPPRFSGPGLEPGNHAWLAESVQNAAPTSVATVLTRSPLRSARRCVWQNSRIQIASAQPCDFQTARLGNMFESTERETYDADDTQSRFGRRCPSLCAGGAFLRPIPCHGAGLSMVRSSRHQR